MTQLTGGTLTRGLPAAITLSRGGGPQRLRPARSAGPRPPLRRLGRLAPAAASESEQISESRVCTRCSPQPDSASLLATSSYTAYNRSEVEWSAVGVMAPTLKSVTVAAMM